MLALVRAQGDQAGITDTVTAVRGISVTVGEVLGLLDSATYSGAISRDLALVLAPLASRWDVQGLASRWGVLAQASRFTAARLSYNFTMVPLPGRFLAEITEGDTMHVEILTSAGGAAYVGGTITEVTGKDISGGTFQISLGSANDPGPWESPDVSTQGATTAIRTVKLLVDNTYPKGTYYAWVRVTDVPEILPMRIQGPIIIR